MPLVDRQQQRSPHPDVVERLLLVIGRHQIAAVPVALLHRDLVAELLDELIARRGRQAAELHCRAVRADRVDPDCLLVRVDAGEPVEIRQPRVIIIGVAHALDRLAELVFGELERARAHDVLLVPARILVEDFLLVDPSIGIGERRQEGAGRKLQMKHHSRRVGRLDVVDHNVVALACARHAFRRVDDRVPARRHVGGCQRRPVVEFDAVADLERVGLAVIGRLRHRGAQVADEVGGRGRVFWVDADQHAIEGRCRMDGRICGLAMTVQARRRVRRNHIGERAAVFWRLAGAGLRNEQNRAGDSPPPGLISLASPSQAPKLSCSNVSRSPR